MIDDALWMTRAIELSRRCTPAETAFSVGAVLVDLAGRQIAAGYSREYGPHTHAEEAALSNLPAGDPRLPGATLFSTLEPCTQRSSRPWTCAQLILAAGVPRVVIAWREPPLFVPDCQGVERLTAAGVTVIELPEFAAVAKAVNAHLV